MKPVWKKEPKELKCELHGLPCLLRRDPSSQAWQGYVGVRQTSILYGLDIDSIAPYMGDWGAPLAEFTRVGDFETVRHVLSLPTSDPDTDGYSGRHNAPVLAMFKVHGGLRFAGMPWAGLQQWSDEAPWFFGFHCQHEYDIVPAVYDDEYDSDLDDEPDTIQRHMDLMGKTVYRTFEYAKDQTENLAAQIAAYHDWIQKENIVSMP
ncbi:hypothetical protein F4827_005269 [Paraburkholderia bannensis]|uniref:Uncharacterized protein n=1 Tax=Paraburkholderia bannensis TaxID=765414 RepID=A0A7W9WVJ1_9BURK|nr:MULTISPECIES: hypothetical protein [Paraburkholderia]MBB3260366.1 hypothetical protein [Paraburkholderia sp. WP4_3_2]MBB6105402.1 hypothetical protein [Paraburkholderia bannensis]